MMIPTDAELANRAAANFSALRDIVLAEEAGRRAAASRKTRGSIPSYLEQERVIGAIPELPEAARDGAREALRELRSVWWALAMTQTQLARRAGRRGQDLHQVAMLALYEAARRYDPAREILFCTFARYWVRMRVDRAAFRDTVVKRPDGMFTVRARAVRMVGAGISRSEIRREIGRDPEAVLALDQSLDVPVGSPHVDSSGRRRVDDLQSAPGADPTEALDLSRALESLSAVDRAHADQLIAGESTIAIGRAAGISSSGAQLREQRMLQSLAEWAQPEIMRSWPNPIGSLVVAVSDGIQSRQWLAHRLGCKASKLPGHVQDAIRIGAVRRDEADRLVPA